MDFVLKELALKGVFTKDEFVTSYKKHQPLNMLDPIWSFVIEEELKKYLESGALVQDGHSSYRVTEKAKETLQRDEVEAEAGAFARSS